MFDIFLLPDPKTNPNPEDFSITCRFCLRKNGGMQMQPIGAYVDKVNSDNKVNLWKKIRVCSDIDICEDDDLLPNNICDKCVNLVLVAHYFRVLSATSDRILRRVVASRHERGPVGAQGQEKCETIIKMEWDCQLDEEDTHNTSLLCDDTDSIIKYSKSLKLNETNYRIDQHEIKRVVDPFMPEIMKMSSSNHLVHAEYSFVKIEGTPAGRENENAQVSKGFITLIGVDDISGSCVTDIVKVDKSENTHKVSSNEMSQKEIHGKQVDANRKKKEPISKTKTKNKFKCYGCGLTFSRYLGRNHHEKYFCPKMPPGTKYKCSTCGENLANRVCFDAHVQFKCPNKAAPSSLKCQRDENKVKTLLKCDNCDYTTFIKANIKNHIILHHSAERSFVCELCGKAFVTCGRLGNHLKFSHSTIEKKYKCPYCTYAAKQSSSLQYHIRIHTQDYRYSCEICGKKFIVSSSYYVHMRRNHKEKDFKCEQCSKMFSVKHALNDHIKVVHMGIKNHKCTECNRAFAKPRDLRAHMLKLHSILIEKKPNQIQVIPKHLQVS